MLEAILWNQCRKCRLCINIKQQQQQIKMVRVSDKKTEALNEMQSNVYIGMKDSM